MSELLERDAMICRSCGNEERASEGYPCTGCGTFICMMCAWKGLERCESCTVAVSNAVPVVEPEFVQPEFVQPVLLQTMPDVAPVPRPLGLIPTGLDWPEH